MRIRALSSVLAGSVVVAGLAVALPGLASASTAHATGVGFQQSQQRLEQQLSNRVSQLQRLTADASGSKTLTAAHSTLLGSRLSSETSAIKALVAKVPGDTTWVELNADRASMLRDNRVYAVMTPQVIQTIESDAIAAQVTTLQASEPTLQAGVNALAGQPGYANAVRHYEAFVRFVNRAEADATDVAAAVLAQVPQDWPGDTHVFVRANHELLNADIALAYAQYDESVIGLATGGYTGS